ncbi:MAG: SH3 domain-containing protein [bacterium]
MNTKSRLLPGMYKVIAPHHATGHHDLKLKENEVVQVSEDWVEFPGWVWCTKSGGESGWVPEAYLTRDSSRAILKKEYHSIELSGERGDVVEGFFEETGWMWAKNKKGKNGWIPCANLEKLKEHPHKPKRHHR